MVVRHKPWPDRVSRSEQHYRKTRPLLSGRRGPRFKSGQPDQISAAQPGWEPRLWGGSLQRGAGHRVLPIDSAQHSQRGQESVT